jgi:hypothetical protein
MAINANSRAICGMNTRMPPNPAMMPSVSKLTSGPLSWLWIQVLRAAMPSSMRSMG